MTGDADAERGRQSEVDGSLSHHDIPPRNREQRGPTVAEVADLGSRAIHRQARDAGRAATGSGINSDREGAYAWAIFFQQTGARL